MEFDQIDDDCTIYIEELKSDDPNLKINAVSKISNIADILGTTRTREELLPYLMEIIDECDNEDEFLIKLSEQLSSLKDKLGGPEYAHLLVSPFELMASSEETAVREKAVESFITLSKDQDQSFFLTHMLHIIKQLGYWENYHSRVSACQLLAHCYPNLPTQGKLEIRQLFSDLANDDTPMVRRATASNIPAIAGVIEKDLIKSELLPLWQLLIKDSVDSVKIKAIESTLKLIGYFNKQEVTENILESLKNADTEKTSWRVRYGLAEVLPSVCVHLEKEVIKRDIFNMFVEFLNDPEQEVKSIAVLKLPEICEKIPEKTILDVLVPALKTLVSDPSPHVRQSIAQVLVKVSKYLNVSNILEHVTPLIQQCYKDEALDVRLAVINTFGIFHQIIGTSNIRTHVLPMILEASNEKNWRSRLAIVEYLPKLCKDIGYELFKSDLEEFVKSFLFDHYSAIRNQALLNFTVLKENFGYEKTREGLTSGLNSLAQSSNYLFRITALHGLVKLKDTLSLKDLNSLYGEFVNKLVNDKVPNVRLNLIKTYAGLKEKWKDSERRASLKSLEILKKDSDKDVKYLMAQIS